MEYLIGSKKGEMLRGLLENKDNEFLSLECTISELRSWTIRENADFAEIYKIVKTNSHIEEIQLDEWINAAEIKAEIRKKIKDFGLIDSLIIAKQKKYKCRIISGDKHFQNFPQIVYLS